MPVSLSNNFPSESSTIIYVFAVSINNFLIFRSRFLAFVQSQNVPAVRDELKLLLNPLMCHLYIELLKGRHSQPAHEFLKKFAHIVGTVDSLAAPLGASAHKLNGSSTMSEEYGAAAAVATLQPSSMTHITYLPSDLPLAANEATEPDQTQYFKELISSMSMCLRIEELDAVEITRNFRYSKYEHELSQRAVFAVKQHLKRNGHVIILHVFQTWFTFDISDVRNSSSCSEDDLRQIAAGTAAVVVDGSLPRVANGARIGGDESSDMDSGIASDWYAQIKNDYDAANVKTENDVDEIEGDGGEGSTKLRKHYNHKLRNIRKAVIQMKTYEQPVRVFKIANTDDQLSCGDIDANECHLACGFNDSTVRLWQLNQSTIYGLKPFASFRDRMCEWNLDQCRTMSDYEVDDDDDDDDDVEKDAEVGAVESNEAKDYLARNFGQNLKRSVATQQFMAQRSSENIL